jgi:TonB family protein
VQRTTRRAFGRGGTRRREDGSEPAVAACFTHGELDPKVLAQLRELQEWAARSQAPRHDGRPPGRAERPPPAAGREPALGAAPEPAPRLGTPATLTEKPAAATGSPPATAREAARPRRVVGIAALVLLVALDGYLLAHRASLQVEPDAAGTTARDAADRGGVSATRPSPAPAPSIPASPALASTAPGSTAPDSTAPAPAAVASAGLAPAAPAPRAPASAVAAPAVAAPAASASAASRPADPAPAAAPPAAPDRASGTAASPRTPRRAAAGTGGFRPDLVPARGRTTPSGRRGAALRLEPGVRPPVLLTVPRIRYAARAHSMSTPSSTGRVHLVDRRRRAVNHVQLAVLVDASGRVATAEVRRGDTSRVGADRAALAAAMAARFRPATRHGVPTRMWAVMTFDFPQ